MVWFGCCHGDSCNALSHISPLFSIAWLFSFLLHNILQLKHLVEWIYQDEEEGSGKSGNPHSYRHTAHNLNMKRTSLTPLNITLCHGSSTLPYTFCIRSAPSSLSKDIQTKDSDIPKKALKFQLSIKSQHTNFPFLNREILQSVGIFWSRIRSGLPKLSQK